MAFKILIITSFAAIAAVLFAVLEPSESKSIELTFELRGREKQCFHEDIEAGTKSTINFQVLYGGELDVDMTLLTPSRVILNEDSQRKWDTYEWNATETGQYTFCFGNEFSISSHKLVYFELAVGDEEEALLPDEKPEYKAAMDVARFQIAAQTIYENLESISEAQTQYRLSEAVQRKRAQDLNSRVMWWSAAETVAVFLVGFIQVWTVKRFFSQHRAAVDFS